MISPKKVLIIIPVYNESKHISAVIRDLKNRQLHVCVINDGSSDNTSEVVQREKIDKFIDLKTNHGKGYALRQGFDYAMQNSYEWVVIMDGDGQHRVSDLDRFFSSNPHVRTAIINGNRLNKYNHMPWPRYLTNKAMSLLISALAGQWIHDCQCGYKMLRTEYLRLANFRCHRFEIEDEILLEASRLGYRIDHVPVSTVYAEETSHIHPWRDTIRFFRFLLEWKTRYKSRPHSK